MKLPRIIPRLIWTVAICSTVTEMALAESKYSAVFESFRISHDEKEFSLKMRKALEVQGASTASVTEDIRYLISLVEFTDAEPIVQDYALTYLQFIASLYANWMAPVEAFSPAIPIFERHLNEALSDPTSKWTRPILYMTAFVGLQPSTQTIPLFYSLLNRKGILADIAVVALARLHPRPPEAKKIIMAYAEKDLQKDDSLSVLLYALDDADLLAIFARSLESENIAEQRRAVELLDRPGNFAAPTLNILRRIETSVLDEETTQHIKNTIERIEGKRY